MLKLFKKYGKSKPAALARNKRYRARLAPRIAMKASILASAAMHSAAIRYSDANPVAKITAIVQHQVQAMKAAAAAMNFGRREVEIKLVEKEQ